MCLGIPGQIVEVYPDGMSGVANISGVKRDVNLGCVLPQSGDAQDLVGEWVLVHVGFAMSVIDEEEALRTLTVLQEIGELQEEMAAIKSSVQGVEIK